MAHCCQVRHVSCSQQQSVLACLLADETCRQQRRCADGHSSCSAWGARWQFRAVLAHPQHQQHPAAMLLCVQPHSARFCLLLLLLHGVFPPISPHKTPQKQACTASPTSCLCTAPALRDAGPRLRRNASGWRSGCRRMPGCRRRCQTATTSWSRCCGSRCRCCWMGMWPAARYGFGFSRCPGACV